MIRRNIDIHRANSMKAPERLLSYYLKTKLILICNSSKGQFGNAVFFKIIVVNCAIEIISYKENQLSIW